MKIDFKSAGYDNFIKQYFPFLFVIYEIVLYLSNDMYLPALPDITMELGFSYDMGVYTIAGWFIGLGILQMFASKMIERYGRKNIFIFFGIMFVLSNFLCIFIYSFIVFFMLRILQGISVSIQIVIGYAAVHDLYNTKKTIKILAAMGMIIVLAPALGPIFGSFIILKHNWRMIFLLLSVFGGVLGTVVYFVIPDMKMKKTSNFTMRGIVNDYKPIFLNKNFIYNALIYSFIVSIFWVWILESPFIVMEGYLKSSMYYGIVQFFVLMGFAIGCVLINLLIDRFDIKNLVSGIFVSLFILSFVLFFTAFYNCDIKILVLVLSFIAMFCAGISSIFNRLTIESSKASNERKVAALFTILTVVGNVIILIDTMINNKTFLNLSFVVFFCVIFAIFINLLLDSKKHI